MISGVRKDLLSEFCMPANTPYVKLAKMLIHARFWLIAEPPKNKEEAIALLVAESIDREKRLSRCI